MYRLVGRTRDDAAGEAYDKVAKLIGLGYPGGPAIDRVAREGDDTAVNLPKPRFTHADRKPPPPDLAASSLRHADRPPGRVQFFRSEDSRSSSPPAVGAACGNGGDVVGALSRQAIADIAASFQRVVVESLVDRTFDAARTLGARSIGIAGGVSANSRLRTGRGCSRRREGLPVFLPALSLSTDNAAMIAAAGLRRLERGRSSTLDFNARARHSISGDSRLSSLSGRPRSSASARWCAISKTAVVLVRRAQPPLAGRWSLPGGAIELGETLHDAIAREVVEETGLVVDVGPVVDVVDHIEVDAAGKITYHFVIVDYLCFPRSGTLRPGDDVDDAVIADVDALDAYAADGAGASSDSSSDGAAGGARRRAT